MLNKNREWVEAITFDYQVDNKKIVKKINKDCQEYKEELKRKQEEKDKGKFISFSNLICLLTVEVPFKMAKFTENAEPVYKLKDM